MTMYVPHPRFILIAVCLGALLFASASTASAQTVETFTGLQHFFKQVVTSGNVITFNGQADNNYLNMPGAGPSTAMSHIGWRTKWSPACRVARHRVLIAAIPVAYALANRAPSKAARASSSAVTVGFDARE